ncbi:MAG: DUF2905 domain-containing protein [Deltaproteobacteria bacterium]|nr:MAG: DUF2905 domain-containing protein [Deltaproteobacteria bacterium]
MEGPVGIGKLLIALGLSLAALGLVIFGVKAYWLGRLPGDIYIKKENFSFYFPVTTCAIISILITIIFLVVRK